MDGRCCTGVAEVSDKEQHAVIAMSRLIRSFREIILELQAWCVPCLYYCSMLLLVCLLCCYELVLGCWLLVCSFELQYFIILSSSIFSLFASVASEELSEVPLRSLAKFLAQCLNKLLVKMEVVCVVKYKFYYE